MIYFEANMSKKMITKEDIEKIVKTYPDKIHCLPKSMFEEQLRNHLCKYFKIKLKPGVKKDKKEDEKKDNKRRK